MHGLHLGESIIRAIFSSEQIVRVKTVLLVILLASILSACGLGFGSGATPTPTLTPTPVVPLAILVVPADMDQEASNAYQKEVYDLANAAGMRFQVRNSMTPADIEPGLQIVIALPPDPGIAALAAAAPNVQFLAINISGITAGGNVSVLSPSSQVDIPAFVAGYTAAMISNDYHAGMIMPKDNPDAQRAWIAFNNGMSYYCGLCQPFYYVTYSLPQSIEIPADEDKTHYPAYADILIIEHNIDTIYVYPDVAVQQLMDYLGTTGTQVMGTKLPNPRPSGWVMTIRPDEVKAIQDAWPSLIAGQGGQTVKSPLGLADVDPNILSPGKQRLVQQVLDGLLNGTIATGVGQ